MPLLKKTAVSAFSLALFLFFTPFALVHNIWCKLVLGHAISIRAGFATQVYATVLTTVEEALKTFMPEADEIQEDIQQLTDDQMKALEEEARIHFHPGNGTFRFFVGKKNGEVIGYAIKDAVDGKWGPIYYMLAIHPNGKIKDVLVLEYQEKRGRPVAKRRFLKQYRGKTVKNKIRVMKDIRIVTGATISSRGMTDGIRKMIHVFNEFYGGK